MQDVAAVACDSYDREEVLSALRAALEPIGGLDWVRPGMKVALKVNLITMLKPEAAATTHPAVVAAMTELLRERKAQAVVGDSPGGPFTAAYIVGVYRMAGLKAAEDAGATLNRDFRIASADFPQAAQAKRFEYTAWLDGCDAMIDLCKLKTHGMMAMTGAAKNLFGTVPGLVKGEYHYRYPNREAFADMLVDLNEYFRPALCVTDAVVAMEGNGPTQGTPRKLGAIVASRCPHSLDLACAHLLGLRVEDVPTLAAAQRRGLIPASVSDLTVHGDLERFVCPDFKVIRHFDDLVFYETARGPLQKAFGRVARWALETVPQVERKACVGCGKCAKVCPAKAIGMRNGLPRIDRRACIRCFCCQELCPRGAMKARRPLAARLLEKVR